MWLAVERYEMYSSDNSKEQITQLYASLPLLPVQLAHFSTIYSSLDILHDKSMSAEEKEFKNSSVPTLILVNQFDPVTPPENGLVLMERLSNGQLYVLDEGGHGGGNVQCRTKVMTNFMNAPSEQLDISCLRLYSED